MGSCSETGNLSHIIAAIQKATTIGVCGHTRPDGDAIGSVLALCLALKTMGKKPQPILADNDAPPELYGFLPGFSGFMKPDELLGKEFDLFIALDTPVVVRLNEAKPLFASATHRAVIDHHPIVFVYGDTFYSRPSAAATGEIIWELLARLGVTPTPDIATCCYAAIVTDTGRFQFQNTNATVLRMAAEMVEAGANPSLITSAIYQSRTYSSLALRGKVMERLTLANNDKVAYSWLDEGDLEELGATLDDYEGLADLVRSVRGIEVAVMLKAEHTGALRGNLRAKNSFDVSEIAGKLGGGGHAAAAGFTMPDTSIESGLSQLLPLLPGWNE